MPTKVSLDPPPPPYTAEPEEDESTEEAAPLAGGGGDGWEGKLRALEEQRVALLLELEQTDRGHVAMRCVQRKRELIRDLRALDPSSPRYSAVSSALRHNHDALSDFFTSVYEARAGNAAKWRGYHLGDEGKPVEMQREFEEKVKEMDKLTSRIDRILLSHSLPLRTWPPPPPADHGPLDWLVHKWSSAEKRRERERREREAEGVRLWGVGGEGRVGES